jgi:acyl dehydratase
MAEAQITPQELEKLIERVGEKMRVRAFNTEATLDSIRHFVNGVGDTNPLWVDLEYARKTDYGTLPAPPSWIFSVFPTWISHSLRGVHSFHSGSRIEFYKPVLLGDRITPEYMFIGFDSALTKFAGKRIFIYHLAKYFNQKGELVAQSISWSARAERSSAASHKKYSSYTLPHPWTEDELKEIDRQVLNEEIRGSTPRYWEDVEIGEKFRIVRGPFGITDMIAYIVGADPVGVKAFRSALLDYVKHPAWTHKSPKTKSWEPVFAVHYDEDAAKNAGLPYPYDVGIQRHALLINMLTNWMGDSGWLKLCYAEYRRFFFYSDVLWITGEVKRKFIDKDGETCVEIETHAVNQRGEDTMPGYSIIALPSKELGYWPVRARLKR